MSMRRGRVVLDLMVGGNVRTRLSSSNLVVSKETELSNETFM
jgi:hypothetical protein